MDTIKHKTDGISCGPIDIRLEQIKWFSEGKNFGTQLAVTLVERDRV